MIILYNDLEKYSKKVIMVDGGFDPIHEGHIKYFNEAKKIGIPIFCNVQSDDYIKNIKKRIPLLPENHRVKVLNELKSIDYVHLCTTSTFDVLTKLKPIKYVKGNDWKVKGLPDEQKKFCEENDIEIVFLDTMLSSSAALIHEFLMNASVPFLNGSVDDFEKTVLTQKEFEDAYYNDHYFTNEWRKKQNSYLIEKRREIEGNNPKNIKKYFRPKNVLDVGCGPGALMLFLHELGINTYGIDFSQAAKNSAPSEIKDKIFIGPITEYHNFGVDFDLVICRETLEHLTVLQIQKTIDILAKYTSKYLYITTRFHPNPKTFLDITNQPEVDPSHITLLNKNFLRTLFILAGLRTRHDLDQKLDWKKYGRVLVFEKATKEK